MKVLDEYGAVGRLTPRAQQAAFRRPREVDQIVTVEVCDLNWRSTRERLTPEVAHAVRVQDKVERSSVGTPGKGCPRGRRALEQGKPSTAVNARYG